MHAAAGGRDLARREFVISRSVLHTVPAGEVPFAATFSASENKSLDRLLTIFHAETKSTLILPLCVYQQFIERFS